MGGFMAAPHGVHLNQQIDYAYQRVGNHSDTLTASQKKRVQS